MHSQRHTYTIMYDVVHLMDSGTLNRVKHEKDQYLIE